MRPGVSVLARSEAACDQLGSPYSCAVLRRSGDGQHVPLRGASKEALAAIHIQSGYGYLGELDGERHIRAAPLIQRDRAPDS